MPQSIDPVVQCPTCRAFYCPNCSQHTHEQEAPRPLDFDIGVFSKDMGAEHKRQIEKAKTDPNLQALREDPRMQELRKRKAMGEEAGGENTSD